MSTTKILCPIDFSPGSDQAMRAAIRIANQIGAELVLLHAWHVPATAFGGELPIPAEVLQQMSDDAERGLAAAVREAGALGARRVSSRLVSGVPWVAITDALLDPDFKLVVIGTHGRTGLARVLLGSVAEKVIRHAPCPVMVVRPDGKPGPFAHVLCPVDFSDCSRAALEFAREIARQDEATLTLLHVIELPVSYSGELPVADFARELDRRSAEQLDQWASFAAAGLSTPVKTRSRIGRPGAEILAVLEEDRTIDLVVVGSHGRTGIRRALVGSVAEKIARHARCPVIVARGRG